MGCQNVKPGKVFPKVYSAKKQQIYRHEEKNAEEEEYYESDVGDVSI